MIEDLELEFDEMYCLICDKRVNTSTVQAIVFQNKDYEIFYVYCRKCLDEIVWEECIIRNFIKKNQERIRKLLCRNCKKQVNIPSEKAIVEQNEDKRFWIHCSKCYDKFLGTWK